MFNTLRERVGNINPREHISKFTSSPRVSRLQIQFNEKKYQVSKFIQANKTPLIISAVIIAIVIFYFVVFFRRIPRFLNRMDREYSHRCQISSIQYNKKIMEGNYRLCDFYIASSYKSYLPCTNYYDYACMDAIKKTLYFGARHIDLDIMPKGFSNCDDLVICNGRGRGNWQYTTSIPLEETLKMISKYAFSTKVPNGSDPLFITLNMKTWNNKQAYEKCAVLIKQYFIKKLLPLEFGFQGRHSRVNISTSPIKKLLDKVIFICNDDVTDTGLDELVNISSKNYGNMRQVTYKEVEDCKDITEFRNFNKRFMTQVVPSFEDRMKSNFNYLLPYYLGCQFICMNYTEPDKWMKLYVETFKEFSFVLKPHKLRNK